MKKYKLSPAEKLTLEKAEKLAEKIDTKYLQDFVARFIKRYGHKPRI